MKSENSHVRNYILNLVPKRAGRHSRGLLRAQQNTIHHLKCNMNSQANNEEKMSID